MDSRNFIRAIFTREARYILQAYAVAPAEEIDREKRWALNRPCVQKRLSDTDNAAPRTSQALPGRA